MQGHRGPTIPNPTIAESEQSDHTPQHEDDVTLRNLKPVFLSQIFLALSFIFLKNSEMLTAFFNTQNYYWHSICSGEIVHRVSFLTGESVFESTSGGRLNLHDLLVTRPFVSGIVVLQHFDLDFENYVFDLNLNICFKKKTGRAGRANPWSLVSVGDVGFTRQRLH